MSTQLETRSVAMPLAVTGVADDQLFRIHFENLPGPAYLWQRVNDDFRLIGHNRAAAALPFSRTAKFVGMLARDLQKGTGHDIHGDLERCAAEGVIVQREVDHRYLESGTVRRLALSMVPVSSEIVVLHTEDITERRGTEQALSASEQKYRTIVDTANEGIMTVDADSVLTYVNERAAQMLGYSAEELVGRSAFDVIFPADREEALRIRARRRAGVKEHFDFRARHRTGAEIWVSVAASPITDDAGNVVGALHMVCDITERKRTEQALKDSQARNSALLHANPDLILRVTRDGRYMDMHSAPNQDPKEEACDVVGRNVRDLFDSDFARRHERYVQKALSTGKVQLWEYVREVNGETRHYEARFVKSGEDEVVVTCRDITHRVALEREVIASGERERTRIGHDLHDGLAQLLIGVKLMIEALTDKLAADNSRHRNDAKRAAELITRAIAQTGELAQGLSPIRKGGRFRDALEQLVRQSEVLLGARCRFVNDETPRGLSEHCAMHLYRIAQEAITNAVKHGKATQIELDCERIGQRFILSVADNGVGIADGATEGRGLGMHIMQYRARSIGGELVVANRAGGGTIVRCYYSAPSPSKVRAKSPSE